MSCEYVVKRAGANLPQTATQTIFTVTGGLVLITGIVGEVTSTIQSQATDVTLYVGADENVIASGPDINGKAAGQLIGSNTGGSARVQDGVCPYFSDAPTVLGDGGVVQLNTDASSTGQVAWYLTYKPLDPGAYVAAD